MIWLLLRHLLDLDIFNSVSWLFQCRTFHSLDLFRLGFPALRCFLNFLTSYRGRRNDGRRLRGHHDSRFTRRIDAPGVSKLAFLHVLRIHCSQLQARDRARSTLGYRTWTFARYAWRIRIPRPSMTGVPLLRRLLHQAAYQLPMVRPEEEDDDKNEDANHDSTQAQPNQLVFPVFVWRFPNVVQPPRRIELDQWAAHQIA